MRTHLIAAALSAALALPAMAGELAVLPNRNLTPGSVRILGHDMH
jgi:hypothetical protein